MKKKAKDRSDRCCHGPSGADISGLRKVILVGSPNVGKSLVFNRLTRSYVTVSNYPGTTVAVDTARARIAGREYGVMDTPGMYSLSPITGEEKVARDVLLRERPHAVLHIADAKSLERMLHLTIEMVEAGLPVILVLNMMDEAGERGLKIDAPGLSALLGVPVVETVSTTGRGFDELRKAIAGYKKPRAMARAGEMVGYDDLVERSAGSIARMLGGAGQSFTKRSLALLLLQGDPYAGELLKGASRPAAIRRIAKAVQERNGRPLKYNITMERQKAVSGMLARVLTQRKARIDRRERLSRLMMRPLTGVPILLLVLYFGLYQFVGVFGAGFLVGLIENGLFQTYINPAVNSAVALIPFDWLQQLIGMDYGIITLGLRYAIAIIFPIVFSFFIMFSVIEDSGYLPRLAMLIDRLFKKIGLNGRAVIPMVLGFGCDTMATIVTRTQETKRERVITTLLLALAIPCSAQLGVIFGILSGQPAALAVWAISTVAIFLLVGFLASRVIPGESPNFYMEIPPLRVPKLSNVITKTYTRMVWYFREVMPLFIAASVVIWAGKMTGAFDAAVGALGHVVTHIGLPVESAQAFLFGFFRRDYGAAGLYDISGAMTGTQLAVAAVTLTLFVPCIAQFSIMVKERGWKTALAIAAFIFPFAFLVGFILNIILTGLGGI